MKNTTGKKIAFSVVAWKLLCFVFAFLASFLIPLNLQFTAFHRFGFNLPYWFWIWGNFDGYHYMEIAERGYQQLEQPFFPLYPYLIYIVNTLFHLPTLLSAQLVSFICFFLALLFIVKLFKLDIPKGSVSLIILIILLYPTSFFYGATYNDSLFLLLATTTIYAARKKRWAISCWIAALATFARLNGLVLFLFLLTEYLSSSEKILAGWNLKIMQENIKKAFSFKEIKKSEIYSLLLIPLAFVSYLGYVQWKFGSWSMVFSTMHIWQQDKLTLPVQVFWRYLKIFFSTPPNELIFWVAVLEFSFTLFYIGMLIFSFKKIRLSYWVFFAISILLPSLTGTFAGMPRYGLHIYPFFLAIYLFLIDKSIVFKIIYFIITSLILFFFIGFYTRGYFVS